MPVIVDGELLIPDGAWLNGELEEFVVSDAKAWANIRFTQLIIGGRSFSVQTRRVVFVIPVQSDIQILGTILKTLVGGGLGAAVGADTGDKRLLDSGLRVGVVASVFSDAIAPVSIVLVRGVTVEH